MAKSAGFSVTELLVVVALVAVLILIGLMTFIGQLGKSRDATRKSDLNKIKVAFEEYHNDNNCYPPPDTLQTCLSTEFKPYLKEVPCDPMTDEPYVYLPKDGNACGGYRVLAKLENDEDPAVQSLGCNTSCGCGYGAEYNYGTSEGVPVNLGACEANATPTPAPSGGATPTPSPSGGGTIVYVYACDPGGTCNRYEEGHPALVNCPVTFASAALCDAAHCEYPENAGLRCNQ